MSDTAQTKTPVQPEPTLADTAEQILTNTPTPSSAFRTYAKDVASLQRTATTPAPNTLPQTPSGPKPEKTIPTPPTPPPPPPAPEPEVEPAYIFPIAEQTKESREQVLARLHAKLDKTQPPAQTPKPKEKATSRDEVLARLREKKDAQTPSPKQAIVEQPPQKKVSAQDPAPLHTYKLDFAEKAQKGGGQLAVLAAEQNSKGTSAPSVLKAQKPNIVPILLGGILLILVGVAGVYGAIQFSQSGKIVLPTEIKIPSLVVSDAHVALEGSGTELQLALANLSTRPLAEGNVTVAYITTASTTAKGKTIQIPATGGALLLALGLPAPDLLLRNTEQGSTVGAMRAGGETQTFFILEVSSYERTFAAMLEWEKTLQADLAIFYPPYQIERAVVASSTTASATPPVAQNPALEQFFSAHFTDEVLENHNVRILRDGQQKSIMLYGYADKSHLIIARNEDAFSELLKRLTPSK